MGTKVKKKTGASTAPTARRSGSPANKRPAGGRHLPSTAGARKQGGQPGNKNALRHGFYANRFTADENKRLDAQSPTDVTAEIALLRVCIDRLHDQLYFEPTYLPNKDGGQSQLRDDHYLKQLNTLGIMAQSIATLTRTHHLIHGKAKGVQDAILQALEELRLEMGI